MLCLGSTNTYDAIVDSSPELSLPLDGRPPLDPRYLLGQIANKSPKKCALFATEGTQLLQCSDYTSTVVGTIRRTEKTNIKPQGKTAKCCTTIILLSLGEAKRKRNYYCVRDHVLPSPWHTSPMDILSRFFVVRTQNDSNTPSKRATQSIKHGFHNYKEGGVS